MKGQIRAIVLLTVGIVGCSGTNAGDYQTTFPNSLSDTLEIAASVEDMTVSGSRLVIVEDSGNSIRVKLYDINDLSLLANIDPAAGGLYFGDMANPGGGTVFISFCGNQGDSSLIICLDVVNQRVDQTWSIRPGPSWRAMAYHEGKIYSTPDSAGVLWRFDPATGSCDSVLSEISPASAGGICSGGDFGIFITGNSDNTLYLISASGKKQDSWAVENQPGPVAWDGSRAYVITRSGLTPVSPQTGKAPQTILESPGQLVCVGELVMVAWKGGIASLWTNSLEYLGTGPTPEPVNLVAAGDEETAFAAARGGNRIYVLRYQ